MTINENGVPEGTPPLNTHDEHTGNDQTGDQTGGKENLSDDNVIPSGRAPVKYDTDALDAFLKAVFHVELPGDVHVYTHISPKAPIGYGKPWPATRKDLKRTKYGVPAYYSTSSLRMDPDEGILRHTKLMFNAYHVLVLDDVGTKIRDEDIPEAMAPNYVVESSEGNFQWGYILAEPITDYDEAQAFIDLFVEAGLTDGGGAMPVKKVRLPCGVNGKDIPGKGQFEVRLDGELDPTPWAVQELLDAAGIAVNWDEYRKDAKAKHKQSRGGARWNPDLFYVDPETGVYDPVLEWLAKEGMVIQEEGREFMDIICPFHDEHTESDLQNQTCGYSPLGHGKYPANRTFSCFHTHCKDLPASAFLEEIAMQGGPHMPAKEFRPERVAGMVYDIVHDRVYDLHTPGRLHPMAIPSVNRVVPKVPIEAGGTVKMVEQLPLWLKQPSALIVQGAVLDPGSRNRITEGDGGDKYVNLFWMPTYPPAEPNMDRVNVFLDFIDYLLPRPEEREYFMKWLACKVQNSTFRGAAIVLVSQAQGTGKNTLMKVLEHLFHPSNVAQVPMDDLIDPKTAFNEWATKLFVNVNESLATADGMKARRAYNRLKEIVDPTAMSIEVNPKYGTKYRASCATSFLFFSNHMDAVYLQEGDRRFFIAEAAREPATPAYFEKVYEWLNKRHWMADLWNYLLRYEVDLKEMMAPAPESDTKGKVRMGSTSPLEGIITAITQCWPSELVPASIYNTVLPYYVERGVPDNFTGVARRLVNDRLTSLTSHPSKINFRTKSTRFLLRDRSLYPATELLEIEFDKAKKAFADFNLDDFRDQIDEWIINQGYDF